MHRPEWSDSSRIALLFSLLAALTVRLTRLGQESLWYDETVSAFLSTNGVSKIIERTAGDIHPPGYYLLLRGWRLLSRPTLDTGLEFLLAWPSLLWGVLLVAMLALLGRHLFSQRVGVLAAWLAAVNPFHVWYAQEVRMYTQAAAIGLLCIWLALRWFEGRQPRWLAIYALCAALGLYTLYYFGFLLIALNLVALWCLWSQRRGRGSPSHGLLSWLAAQVAVLLLYAPWIPVLWRQTIDPPVPPWRAAWNSLGDLLAAIVESSAGLTIGQAPPFQPLWIWSALALVVVLLATVPPLGRQDAERLRNSLLLLQMTVIPIGLIYLGSALVTPLYHIRYVFTYASPFLIITAVAVDELWRRRRWTGGAALTVLTLVSAAALADFWTAPQYRADDHRGAVAQLAQLWRPGDLILVNAGWAHTAIDTYWPTISADPWTATPPPIDAVVRLPDHAASLAAGVARSNGAHQPVTVVRTGSVDGDPSLGWGNPESDFFAQSAIATAADLEALAAFYPRIWHYRIYDTVSDPEGVIRSWLDEEAMLMYDWPAPGRDFLRVQRYDRSSEAHVPAPGDETIAHFGDQLMLTAHTPFEVVEAGTILFTTLDWFVPHANNGEKPTIANLRTSLRLYDADGYLWSQQDESLPPHTPPSLGDAQLRQPLALPVPPALRPGKYYVDLIVYDGDTGSPLKPLGGESPGVATERQIIDDRWLPLGTVTVMRPKTPPQYGPVMARFDYLDLVAARVTEDRISTGEGIPVEVVWRPRPNSYNDNYSIVLELRATGGAVMGSQTDALGAAGAPSSSWTAQYPILDRYAFSVGTELPPGKYTLHVGLIRSADGLRIPARSGLLPFRHDTIPLGEIRIVE